MEAISGLALGAAPQAAADVKKARPAQAQPQQAARREDVYISGEKEQPTGLYRPGRDADGRPKVYYDGPARAETPDEPGPAPEKGGDAAKPERCRTSTDRVDREIEKLKKRKRELTQQLRAETDEARREALQTELAQVERALRQKDNDAYRRSHAQLYAPSGSPSGREGD